MESRQEILVGLSISLTGRFSAQGRQALDGLRLWQSYVNGRHGITIGQDGPRPWPHGFWISARPPRPLHTLPLSVFFASEFLPSPSSGGIAKAAA